MMRWARTSPMPGSAVSCSVSARLMSMGNVTATVSGVVGSGRVVWGGDVCMEAGTDNSTLP